MSSNPLTAMLDELMGRNRNAVSADEHQKETTWDDPDVCPYFIAGYCPHEMFTNTKADLGPCSKLHDEKLKEQYKKSSRFEKVGLEEEFLEYLLRVQADMRRKIDRNKQRLELTQPGGDVEDADKEKIIDKTRQLSEKISSLILQAEQLGEKGEVDEAQKVVKMMEELTEERDRLQQNLDAPSGELRSMEVCDICGCFLVTNDAQHRLDEHFTGKQHIGFAKIKVTTDELMKKKHEKREQRDKQLKELREKEEKRRRRSRSRSKSRITSRNKSRDRSRRRSSSKGRHISKDDRSRRRSRSKDVKNDERLKKRCETDRKGENKKNGSDSRIERNQRRSRSKDRSRKGESSHSHTKRDGDEKSDKKDEKRPKRTKEENKMEVDKNGSNSNERKLQSGVNGFDDPLTIIAEIDKAAKESQEVS